MVTYIKVAHKKPLQFPNHVPVYGDDILTNLNVYNCTVNICFSFNNYSTIKKNR